MPNSDQDNRGPDLNGDRMTSLVGATLHEEVKMSDENSHKRRLRATMRTTDPDSEWLARMRRAVANFLPEKGKGSPESSAAENKPLSINEQIYAQLQWERLDRCGFYQLPRRHRNVEPLDELLGPAGKEAEDAEVRKPDEPSKED